MDSIKKTDFDIMKSNIRQGNYKFLGSGSGRRVLDLGNGYVVKIAKNKKGIAQNEAEYRIASTDQSNLFAKITQVSEDYNLVIMEKAEKVRNFSDVKNYFKVKNNRELFKLEEFENLFPKHHLLLMDLCRPNNWGIINNRPVIIDYGFTSMVKNKYYSRF